MKYTQRVLSFLPTVKVQVMSTSFKKSYEVLVWSQTEIRGMSIRFAPTGWCRIEEDDRIRPANLLPIHMFDFDVILGMGLAWLLIELPLMLCRTVLDLYYDTSWSVLILKFSIVRDEFADVFPDELPGLPPAREIEFGIELIPGAEPISKAPYRMAPVELKELKEQLQEYVGESAFIRPVRHHYGSSKVEVITNGETIRWTEVRSFLGLMANYRRFVEGFSRLALPSYLMMRQGSRDAVELWAIVRMLTTVNIMSSVLIDDGVVWFEVGYVSPYDQHFARRGQQMEHQRASGLLQPLEDSYVKLGCDSMDLVTGLPTTQKRHDAIWVGVDRVNKDRSLRLVLERITEKLGNSSLNSVTSFHPQNRCSWDEYLCLVEFAYNNSWHASIKAAPFELLYGRKCRAPICWDEVGERLIEGPELIEITNEKVAVAKEKLKEARSRQKSCIDGKLSPRFIGPFEILERIGEVSYRLALPPQLSHVHDVFHVSLLRGYHYHPLHVASYPFDQIQPDMSLSEEPESILDRQERVMRNKVIPFVKILWKNHPEREATWETEESMRASYPHFFV
ncbi:putative nucleotidyltransferase, ribonuclease H [Tanacetum coccineum]